MTLNDPLPSGGGVNWTTASAGCGVGGAPGAQTLTCSFGDLIAGASRTVVVSAVTSLAACTTMPNLATASATNNPSVEDPGNITCQGPNLSIVKTPDGQAISAGATATFTIVVTSGAGNGHRRFGQRPAAFRRGRELDDGHGGVRCGRGAGRRR